ncbi:MAG: hypothetical protein ACI9RO_002020, partial [Alteromonas macleodii]
MSKLFRLEPFIGDVCTQNFFYLHVEFSKIEDS